MNIIVDHKLGNFFSVYSMKYFQHNNVPSKLAIIIQARTNSKRLLEKVLKKIGNKTVLEHLITRLKKLNLIKIYYNFNI